MTTNLGNIAEAGNSSSGSSSPFFTSAYIFSSGVGGSTTRYLGIGESISLVAVTNPTFVSTVVDFPFTVSLLRVTTGAAQSGTGSFVVNIYKNGGATAVSAIVTAGGAAGTYSDEVNSVSFVEGDLICLQLVNNASATAAVPVLIQCKIQPN